MTGLVLEGGTFRPIFSAGVMDALLKEDILLPYCIGVSAGISDAYSDISRQIWAPRTSCDAEACLGWTLCLTKSPTGLFPLI